MLIKTADKYNPSDEDAKENNIIIISKENLKAHAKYQTLNTKYWIQAF